jgi:hypothetical protein
MLNGPTADDHGVCLTLQHLYLDEPTKMAVKASASGNIELRNYSYLFAQL